MIIRPRALSNPQIQSGIPGIGSTCSGSMALAVGIVPVHAGFAVMLANSPSLAVQKTVLLSGTVDVPFHRGLMVSSPASSNRYGRKKPNIGEGIVEELNQ